MVNVYLKEAQIREGWSLLYTPFHKCSNTTTGSSMWIPVQLSLWGQGPRSNKQPGMLRVENLLISNYLSFYKLYLLQFCSISDVDCSFYHGACYNVEHDSLLGSKVGNGIINHFIIFPKYFKINWTLALNFSNPYLSNLMV